MGYEWLIAAIVVLIAVKIAKEEIFGAAGDADAERSETSPAVFPGLDEPRRAPVFTTSIDICDIRNMGTTWQ